MGPAITSLQWLASLLFLPGRSGRVPPQPTASMPAVAVMVVMLATGCGGGDGTGDPGGAVIDGSDPVTENVGNTVSGGEDRDGLPGTDSLAEPDADAPPVERIVSLSPSATETLFAIGAGTRVVAVDLNSDHPGEAPRGMLDGFAPDLDAILAERPELVVATGLPDAVVTGLEEAEVAVLIQPPATDLRHAYAQIVELGAATGRAREADRLVAELGDEIDEILVAVPDRDEPLVVFHEIDDSYFTATSATFVGSVYREMGLVNAADSMVDGGGYVQVDDDDVVASAPDIIVFTDQAPYDASDIAARPGWGSVPAVLADRIVEVDADVTARWGPRTVELVRVVAEVAAR